MDAPTIYRAVPGQRALFNGVCSKTGMPLVFIAYGTLFPAKKEYRWYCKEIQPEDQFVREATSPERPRHIWSNEEATSPFVLAETATCPGCGASGWQYFRCGKCKELNCFGSITERAIGHWWNRKSETISRCGNCWIEKVFAPTPMPEIEVSRDMGAIVSPAPPPAPANVRALPQPSTLVRRKG